MSQRSFVRACHQTDELLILIFGGLTYTVTYIVQNSNQSNRAALAPIKCGASCVGHASLTSLLLPPHLILRRERECKVEKNRMKPRYNIHEWSYLFKMICSDVQRFGNIVVIVVTTKEGFRFLLGL